MPYLNILTNVDFSESEAASFLKDASSQLAEALGKPESYVQTSIQRAPMTFGGSGEPTAHLELQSLGLPPDAPKKLSPLLCEMCRKSLNIQPERVYVHFQSPPRESYGWSGKTFG